MVEKPCQSVSYLLRIWQAREGDKAVWRCSLQNSVTGEVRGFPTLDAMSTYLVGMTNTLTLQKPASPKERKKAKDQISAVIILSDYLESKRFNVHDT